MIARFEQAKLLVRTRGVEDARQRVLALTPAGRKTFAGLDAAASADIAKLLGRLADHDQQRVVSAMTTSRQRSARRTTSRRVASSCAATAQAISAGSSSVMASCTRGNTAGTSSSRDWSRASAPSSCEPPIRPRARTWIAEVDGERAGSIMLVAKSRTVAQLRLLLVEPHARGLGIGAELVAACLRFAKAAGYKRIVLWTRACGIRARAQRQAPQLRPRPGRADLGRHAVKYLPLRNHSMSARPAG